MHLSSLFVVVDVGQQECPGSGAYRSRRWAPHPIFSRNREHLLFRALPICTGIRILIISIGTAICFVRVLWQAPLRTWKVAEGDISQDARHEVGLR